MKHQMPHEEWIGKMIARVVGELTSTESVALDAHLRSCEACTQEMREYEALARELHVLEKNSSVQSLPPNLQTLKREIQQASLSKLPEEANAGSRVSGSGSILRIQAHCSSRFFEVLQDKVESCELVVEEMMSYVLLDLFGEGTVDGVMIQFASSLLMGLQQCNIQILAQCNCEDFVLQPRTEEHIKGAVHSSLSSLLKQLFGSVHVDSVTVLLTPTDDSNSDMALFYSL